MDLRAMVDDCQRVIQERGTDACVVYKIPRPARGNRIRLTPLAGSPLGDVMQGDKDKTVARFAAVDILKWVKRLSEARGKELDDAR